MRGQGRVGPMRLWRTCNNKDAAGVCVGSRLLCCEWTDSVSASNEARGKHFTHSLFHDTHTHPHKHTHTEVRRLVQQGDSPNEVEAAGNVPLHACAWQNWVEGIDLLIQLGAKVRGLLTHLLTVHVCVCSCCAVHGGVQKERERDTQREICVLSFNR